MRILRCGDGVNCMVCDQDQIVVGLLNKTIEVYERSSLVKVTSDNKKISLRSNGINRIQVRTLWGHDDHVWSIDMNKEYIVSGSWDSR